MEATVITMNEVFTRLNLIKTQYAEGVIDKTDALSDTALLLVVEVIADSKDNRDKANAQSDSIERLRKIQEIMLLSELE